MRRVAKNKMSDSRVFEDRLTRLLRSLAEEENAPRPSAIQKELERCPELSRNVRLEEFNNTLGLLIERASTDEL